jgi:rhodanese-related sulfurtransferase
MQDIIIFLQHHWALSLAFIIVLVILLVIETIKQKNNDLQLTPAKLTQLINRDNAAVIDLRPVNLYNEGHIIGALSIPVDELETSKKLDKLTSRPIVLICSLGTDSLRATTLLAKKGIKTSLLSGGLRAWQDANMPLIKD